MTLSSKELLESATPPSRFAAPSNSAAAKPDASRLHSDGVSLQLPLKIHGSRVTKVVLGSNSNTEPFEEEASTMIVFPHGGVLRMTTVVFPRQMLVLTNQKSKRDAICRVVKVRNYSNTQAYVEVEFINHQLGYWGVRFPADDDLSASQLGAARATVPSAPIQKNEPSIVSSVSVKVGSTPKASTASPDSAFVSIGSQEETQPSASTTASSDTIPSLPGIAREPDIRLTEQLPRITAMPAKPAPVAPPAAPSQAKDCGAAAREEVAASVEVPVATQTLRPSLIFGALTDDVVSTASTTDMGSRPGHSLSESSPQTSARLVGKGLLIAACAVLFLAAAAAGYWYSSHQSSAPEVSQLQSSSSGAASASKVGSQSAPAETTNAAAAQPSSRIARAASEIPSSTPSLPRVYAPSSNSKPSPMGNILAVLRKSRPVTKRSAGAKDVAVAPEVPVAPLPSDIALPGGIASASPDLIPPPESLRVGGNFVPARVVRSKLPVYSASSALAGIEGDVVIRAQIDEAGNVVGTQVLSGPATLRQAALDALKTWKYQPGMLNGKPVASQVNVTLQFRK